MLSASQAEGQGMAKGWQSAQRWGRAALCRITQAERFYFLLLKAQDITIKIQCLCQLVDI